MAYRSNHIKEFIEKINKEAEEAAQAVYDKHNDKLQEMINNQVLSGQRLIVGMGTATIVEPDRDLRYDYAENFLTVVSDTQYHKDSISAGFFVNDCDKRIVKYMH